MRLTERVKEAIKNYEDSNFDSSEVTEEYGLSLKEAGKIVKPYIEKMKGKKYYSQVLKLAEDYNLQEEVKRAVKSRIVGHIINDEFLPAAEKAHKYQVRNRLIEFAELAACKKIARQWRSDITNICLMYGLDREKTIKLAVDKMVENGDYTNAKKVVEEFELDYDIETINQKLKSEIRKMMDEGNYQEAAELAKENSFKIEMREAGGKFLKKEMEGAYDYEGSIKEYDLIPECVKKIAEKAILVTKEYGINNRNEHYLFYAAELAREYGSKKEANAIEKLVVEMQVKDKRYLYALKSAKEYNLKGEISEIGNLYVKKLISEEKFSDAKKIAEEYGLTEELELLDIIGG